LSQQKTQKSNKMKIIGTILIFAIAIVVIIGAISLLPNLNNSLSAPTPTPKSTPKPTPKPTPTASIRIYYGFLTSEKIYGDIIDVEADSGKVFLKVIMTISNDGYVSFNTNPNYFYVTVNNVKYGYDVATFTQDDWETVDVLNDGRFSGTLVFQVPSYATSYTLSYQAWETYNNIYEEV
jgi:hypothetical protein